MHGAVAIDRNDRTRAGRISSETGNSAETQGFTADSGFHVALARTASTLAFSIVPGGVFLIGCPDSAGPLHIAHLPLTHAWGLAADSHRLAVATHREIIVFARTPLPASTHPERPGYFDAFFTPRVSFFTGECLIHDMAIVRPGLLTSNTRFSNVSIIDGGANFEPVWHPPFISAITPEDRCHLNGIAVEDGHLRYVTAFGPFDEPQGWRSRDLDAGLVLDVTRNTVLTGNLCLPHSPRLIGGRLLVLEAGTGRILRVDRTTGECESLAALPGFARGLTGQDGVLFIGLSAIRQTRGETPLPVARSGADLVTGIAAIDAENGTLLGLLRFAEDREIFDLALIPSATSPGIFRSDAPGDHYALDSRAGGYWMRHNGTNTEACDAQETH